MKFIKPNFWDKVNLFSVALYPLSLLFIFIIFLRKKLSTVRTFKIPIICVGNIYLGGTGKTPLSIYIAKELLKTGAKPIILRKFYKSHSDEYNLIKNKFNNLLVNKNRIDALNELNNSNYDIVILDDGLQDYKIKIDLKIVCFNQNQLIGNGFVLPAGPLREGLDALKETQIVIINGVRDEKFEKKLLMINKNLEIYYSYYKPTNLEEFADKRLYAIAGIGNPENFFQTIEKNNLKIEKKLIFPDHYQFSKKEVENILNEAERKNYQIVTTEKDYYKIKHFNLNKIKYLKVNLVIDNQDRLMRRINKFHYESN